MSKKEQDDNLKAILGAWPNTYTFTKSMAERTLRKKRRPDLPVLLVRPSIISGAWKEPVPGWTDTISAAGGISLGGGIGIINWVHGHGDNLADLIPVDIVSNIIVAGTALQAGDPCLRVVHSTSSQRNPLRWGPFRDYTMEYLQHQPYEMQAFKPSITFIPNKKVLMGAFFLNTDLPVRVMEKLSKVPGVGTPSFKKQVEKGKMIRSKAWDTAILFSHFTNNSWTYESRQVDTLMARMTPED